MTIPDPNLIPLNVEADSSDSPKRARRADALANRELILQTAEQLFAAQGIATVKMMAIAEAANIGQGTLYRAFANKGELCLALLDEDLQAFQEETLALFHEMSGQPALDQLEQFLDRLIHFLDIHAALMCEVQGYQIFGDEISPLGLNTWFHQTVNLLLRRGQATGEVRAEADLGYLTDAILAPLTPTLFTAQRQTGGMSLAQISRELRQLVLNGIRAAEEGV